MVILANDFYTADGEVVALLSASQVSAQYQKTFSWALEKINFLP